MIPLSLSQAEFNFVKSLWNIYIKYLDKFFKNLFSRDIELKYKIIHKVFFLPTFIIVNGCLRILIDFPKYHKETKEISFFLNNFNLFFSHKIYGNRSLPFLLSFQALTLQFYLRSIVSIFFQKRSGLPGISTEPGKSHCIKTRHIISYQGWLRQLSRRK